MSYSCRYELVGHNVGELANVFPVLSPSGHQNTEKDKVHWQLQMDPVYAWLRSTHIQLRTWKDTSVYFLLLVHLLSLLHTPQTRWDIARGRRLITPRKKQQSASLVRTVLYSTYNSPDPDPVGISTLPRQ